MSWALYSQVSPHCPALLALEADDADNAAADDDDVVVDDDDDDDDVDCSAEIKPDEAQQHINRCMYATSAAGTKLE